MIQTENPTQTVVRTRAQATRRVTERVGKRLLNMACDCGANVCFSRLTSTSCYLASSLVAVHALVGRDQDVGHRLRQLDVLQAVIDCCLAVGVPQQAEVGAVAGLFTEAKVPADRG